MQFLKINLQKILILSTIFLTPLIFLPNQILGFEIAKILTLAITTTLLLINQAILLITGRIKLSFTITPIKTALLLFFLTIIITSLLGENPTQSFWGAPWRRQGIFTLTLHIIFFLLTLKALKDKLKPRLICETITFSALIVSLYLLGQAFTYLIFHQPVAHYPGLRFSSTFSNPNLTAGFLALSLPYTLHLLKITKFPFLKKIYTTIIFIILTSSIFTLSKSGFLSLAAILFFFTIFNCHKPKIKLTLFTLPLIILIFYHLFNNIPFLARPSLYENRLTIWSNALQAIALKPLTGYGLENFEFALQKTVDEKDPSIYNYYIDRAHNEVLEITTASGILGLLLFLILIFLTYQKLFKKITTEKNRQTKSWYQTLTLSLTAFLTFTQFNFFLTTGYLYFYFTLAAIDASKKLTD